MTQGYARFLEVLSSDNKDALIGVIGVEIDGYAKVHVSWIKELLHSAGYQYEEVTV